MKENISDLKVGDIIRVLYDNGFEGLDLCPAIVIAVKTTSFACKVLFEDCIISNKYPNGVEREWFYFKEDNK